MRPCGARKNTAQLAKYPHILYAKPSNKVYVFFVSCNEPLKIVWERIYRLATSVLSHKHGFHFYSWSFTFVPHNRKFLLKNNPFLIQH